MTHEIRPDWEIMIKEIQRNLHQLTIANSKANPSETDKEYLQILTIQNITLQSQAIITLMTTLDSALFRSMKERK